MFQNAAGTTAQHPQISNVCDRHPDLNNQASQGHSSRLLMSVPLWCIFAVKERVSLHLAAFKLSSAGSYLHLLKHPATRCNYSSTSFQLSRMSHPIQLAYRLSWHQSTTTALLERMLYSFLRNSNALPPAACSCHCRAACSYGDGAV